MFTITALQIKAARGLLEWSQDKLASAARLSPATIRNIEGGLSAKKATMDLLRDTFQSHGVEFLFSNGVRHTARGLKDFVGSESCDHFFGEVVRAIKERGGNFVCWIHDSEMLTFKSGLERRSNLQRLNEVQKLVEVKCLLRPHASIKQTKTIPIRVSAENSGLIPVSYFVYNGCVALAYIDWARNFVFVLFENDTFARQCQKNFLSFWQAAKPLEGISGAEL
jgi:hypothetical protein